MRSDPIYRISPATEIGPYRALISVSDRLDDSTPHHESARLTLAASARRLWRVFGTGLSFAVFGASAVSFTLLVFPLCSLLGGGVCRKQARVQRVIHHAYHLFVKLMEGLGLIRTD